MLQLEFEHCDYILNIRTGSIENQEYDYKDFCVFYIKTIEFQGEMHGGKSKSQGEKHTRGGTLGSGAMRSLEYTR